MSALPGRATARTQVAQTARRLAELGLVHGTAGNVSARCDDELIAITPTGAHLAETRSEEVAIVDLDGRLVDGPLAPTSELDLHLGVYRAHGAGAVVHTHAPVSTAISCVLDELPCVHYEMLMLGGPVRVAPYATFGTPELAASAVTALEGRTAALLANHGTIAFGVDLGWALRVTELLEWSATLYWRAASLGTPRVLDEADRQAVIDVAIARQYGTTQQVDQEEQS